MEIGLDYMHIRSRAEHYGLRWAGIALLLVGIGLALAGASYYGYIFWLRFGLDDYNAQWQGQVELLADAPTAADADGRAIVRELALFPTAGAERAAALGFTPTAGTAPGELTRARELGIAAVGLKIDLGELISTSELISRYATEAMSAGQIEDLANPGELGALWFLGPAGGAADSFSGLKDAPDSLAGGGEIQIIVNNGEQDYLYLATHSDVIPADDFSIPNAALHPDRATVHLAVPVPDGMYDHFLVLSGELVGVR